MEITKKNFAEQLDKISKDLKRSCFIGFDAEFTAILAGDTFKHKLFDTCEERYDKIKYVVDKMIMTQVGLTMFQYERDLDTYKAVGYTFHLCPQVFGDVDQSFIFQASTLRFLCRHNFDFNKFTYEGLPYLSKAEEENIRKQLKDKQLFSQLSGALEMENDKLLQRHCSDVSKWLTTKDDETMYIDVEDPVLRYLLHNELRLRFDNILTTDSLGNSRKILVYRDKNVEGAYSAPMQLLEENLLKHMMGFSQIINLLSECRKPIIGHNLFLDTILLHNQFIGPLPKAYATFKSNINNLLPTIFDTKYISHEMSKKLTLDEVWKSNALQDLYEFFSGSKCKKLEQGVNFVRLETQFNVKQSYHEAGWDSYCSGYCFIRLGHWSACELSGSYRPVGPREKLTALAAYCNKVNVIRGAVPYMNLLGDDPPRHRPNILYIKCIKERAINVGKVVSSLAAFGSVDVKPFGSRAALVAVSTQHTVDRIMKQFGNSQDYKIAPYNVMRHSAAAHAFLWGGAILTTGVVLYLIQKNQNVTR